MMIETPVPAEYWVFEMITVKKELVKQNTGKRKIIIAGGSSTLFSIDAEYASVQLGMPVINFGLHAGLRLEKILKEVNDVVESGDILVLPLEPSYYDCNSKFSLWQINNIVGWDHDAWKEMSNLEKLDFVSSVSRTLFVQMIIANIQRIGSSTIIDSRLAVLDSTSALEKFRIRRIPVTFRYSAYNLNDHGDMLRTEGSRFGGKDNGFSGPSNVCNKTANQLVDFIDSMKAKGVQVFFANTPYITSGVGMDILRRSESSFLSEFSRVGCFIDKREDLLFDPKYFFDFKLHLNAEGRSVRTELLIQAIRKNILSGVCGH